MNLLSNCFDIRFDDDSSSNKSIVTMSHGVSMKIKMERWDLAMRLGFKKDKVLHESAPIVSPFMANIK